MAVRKHIFVSGKVQGVTFRASTRKKARELGVGGWVRNLPDGRVEAVFEGKDEDVEELIKWCHSGPSLADVEDVEVKEEEPVGLNSFRIKY